MTVRDQIKIIDNKIKVNQVQCDLDRLAVEISALSSGELGKYEYLTGEYLRYKPSALEQIKFDHSPMGKAFNMGLDDKDDKKEGLLKRLKNIEKNQSLNNNNNNNNNNQSEPSSARSKSSIYLTPQRSVRSKSSEKTLVYEGEDENEKTECDLYQDSIEGMKGLELPGEIDKDEKFQMYLENNLRKIRNQRFFKYIANEEENSIDYKMHSSKVKDISFFDRYGTLYKYLNNLLEFGGVERISKI